MSVGAIGAALAAARTNGITPVRILVASQLLRSASHHIGPFSGLVMLEGVGEYTFNGIRCNAIYLENSTDIVILGDDGRFFST